MAMRLGGAPPEGWGAERRETTEPLVGLEKIAYEVQYVCMYIGRHPRSELGTWDPGFWHRGRSQR
jgi:hypothetical protein